LRINTSLKLPPSARQQTNINRLLLLGYFFISLHRCTLLSAVLPSVIIRRRIDDLSTPATTLCPFTLWRGEERRRKIQIHEVKL